AELAIPPGISWGFLGAFYAGSVCVYLLSVASGRFLFGRDLASQAIFGMCGAFANLVLLGIPVVLTAFGEEAMLPMLLIIGFDAMIVMPLTVALIHGGGGADAARAGTGGVASALARNPIIIGLLLGLVVNLLDVGLPAGIDRMVEMMGAAAVPTALFAMGASL